MSNEALLGVVAAAFTTVGVLGKSAFDRWKRRDELDASHADATIKKLWAQVEAQQTEIRALRVELDRCKDAHREARSEADALRRDVQDLREELNALKATVRGARG